MRRGSLTTLLTSGLSLLCVLILDDSVVKTYDERGPFKVLTLEDIVSNVLSVAERMSSDATCSSILKMGLALKDLMLSI